MRQEDLRPRILFANAMRLWGGGEKFVVDAAAGLRDRGWQTWVQAQPGSVLSVRSREAGVPVHEVRTRANGAPWTVLPLALWLVRNRIDIVITNFDKDLRTTGLAARLAPRAIRLTHSFECDEPFKQRWYLPHIYTTLADSFLFNSESTRATVLASAPRLGHRPHRVLAKGVAIDTLEGTTPKATAEVVFGFLGQLITRKDLPILLHALKSINPHGWKLRVGGTGPRLSAWQHLSEELGLSDRVHFDGFVRDTRTWFGEIDVLVHPARSEGWGYAPIEALAAGRLVVARRVSSVGELLAKAPAVRFFDDKDGLSKELDQVLSTPHGNILIEARDARAFVRDHYGIDKMVCALETHLLELADGIEPPRHRNPTTSNQE